MLAISKCNNIYLYYALCGGKDCAVRIGFYYREEIIVNFQTYKDVPIARYLCRKKGPGKYSHKTFSLLPSFLVPYHKQDLTLISETLSCLHRKNLSLSETIDKIGVMGSADFISLGFSQLHGFQHIFNQAFAKLSSLSQLENLLPSDKSDPVTAMLNLISTYQSSEIYSKTIF